VIERAKILMDEMQRGEHQPGTAKKFTQLLLIDSPEPALPDPVIRELGRIDPDALTPRQALEKLYELRMLSRERRS
jgi:DNA mismatch repair ATPase MutS